MGKHRFACLRNGVVALAVLLSLTACGSEAERAGSSTNDPGSIEPPPAATIEASGFGQKGEYLWVTAIVRNESDEAGQFIVVSFNLFDEAGTILGTESQTEQVRHPHQRMFIGTQVTAPRGGKVARIEPALRVNDHDLGAPEFSDVALNVGPVQLSKNDIGHTVVQATLANPSDKQLPGARVGLVCFNRAGAIIGGGSNYPDLIPARGQILVDDTPIVTGEPDRCEIAASPGT